MADNPKTNTDIKPVTQPPDNSGTLSMLMERKKASILETLKAFESEVISLFETELAATLDRIEKSQQRSYASAISKIEAEVTTLLS